MDQEYRGAKKGGFFAPIRAHWWKMLVFAIFCGILSALFSIYFITPKYQAEALLIVNNAPEATQTSTSDGARSAQQLVNTYAVVLKGSTGMLEDVIDELSLRGITASQLGAMLGAGAVNNTQVMRLTLQHENPALAQSILQEILLRSRETLVETVKASSVEIISNASVSGTPASPNIVRNAALGGGAGLLLALAFVCILGLFKNTFVTDDDITRELGLTVLGVIPKIQYGG